jgi:hypothetical protein
MAVTVDNLVQGPATIYIGDFGATEPTNASSTPSSADWTDIGGTTDGATVSINQEYKELEVDQVIDIPGRRLVKRDMSVKTNMAEPTLENLVYALNDGTFTTGAQDDTYEPAFTDSATQPTYRAVLLRGWSAGLSGSQSKRRLVVLRRVLSSDNVEFAYKKEDQTVFTVTWSVHYVSTATAPFLIKDEA